jgi:hypothetical protein
VDPPPDSEARTACSPLDCPYRDPKRPLGCLVVVGLAFPNGDIRLARDLSIESPTWNWSVGLLRNPPGEGA